MTNSKTTAGRTSSARRSWTSTGPTGGRSTWASGLPCWPSTSTTWSIGAVRSRSTKWSGNTGAPAACTPTTPSSPPGSCSSWPVPRGSRFYTTTETRKEVQPAAVHATNRQVSELAADDYEIYEAFAPEPGDIIIYKERASGFYGTPLIAHLTRLGVRSLIVCGESTSGCVRASVVDAYSNGYHVSVVEECVFDRSVVSHKVNLFDLHHKYADVMKLAEVREHFGRKPLKAAV